MKLLYQQGLKPILFRFDPERVHDAFVALGELLGWYAPTRRLIERVYSYRGPDLSVRVDGIRHPTPVVLASGFDYNGRLR